MDQIEFNSCIDDVLQYFTSHEIEVSRPAITFSEIECKVGPFAMTIAQSRMASARTAAETAGKMSRHVTSSLFNQADFDLTDEGLEEYEAVCINYIKSQIVSIMEEHPPGIVVYPILFHQTEDTVKELLAHEMWHYIESEQGLFDGFSAVEGTAEFARRSYTESMGKQFNPNYVPPGMDPSIHELTYQKPFEIVAKYASTLKDLLDQTIRSKIAVKYNAYLSSYATEGPTSKQTDTVSLEDMGAALRNIPPFAQISKPYEKDSIVYAFQDLGATRIAEQINASETRSLISLFTKLNL